MRDIKPFIDLGWYTVPLSGELKRKTDGSKTIPIFQENWKEFFSENINQVPSILGGVLTGEISGIVAIDCDNTETYELFRALDPDYPWVFKSKGKLTSTGEEKNCGTLIYSYDTEVDTFKVNNGEIALDFYSDGGFVYLPTKGNTTKEDFSTPLPPLEPPPVATITLLRQLKKLNDVVLNSRAFTPNTLTANCLAPLVTRFTESGEFLPGLFKIITPKDFRRLPQYVSQGFLHPQNVPEGRGSEYLSKVSAILGADISIDEELYNAAIHDINGLWHSPMDADRLDATITDPMVEGKSSIDGRPIWNYDPDWETFRLILSTKRQSSIELGFDDYRNLYYCVDVANENTKEFQKDNELYSYVTSVSTNLITKTEMKTRLPIINVTSDPSEPFGFISSDDPTARTFNRFIRTPELGILLDPSSYSAMYKEPTTTLKFLESMVPDTVMREYLLRFLKRKLTTFNYSPVTLYFLGAPGAGKDTFVQLIEKIMGKIARPTVKEWLEAYNGWLLDSYFVQLDEFGDQLNSMRDKEEAFGKLKAYTGKQTVSIRKMRTDSFSYEHSITFIQTANKNPFGLEDNDRRIALFNTPNILTKQDWIQDIQEFHESLMSESKDFAYYLATEIESANNNEYMTPPETQEKRALIADSMYPAKRIAYCLKYDMMEYLNKLAIDHNCDNLIKAIDKRRLYSDDLEELYDSLTDYNGDMKSLNKSLRAAGVKIVPTTHNGIKRYLYDIECFRGGPFEED